MATQDDYIRTALRVPPDLHKQLHEAATANNRTFNAEIVSRLQDSFHQSQQLTNTKNKELLDAAADLLELLLEKKGISATSLERGKLKISARTKK